MSDVTVSVNGKPRTVADGASLLDLLKELDVSPSRVVIEHNREIRRKDDFAKTVVHAGDELELVYFVGGGSTDDDSFVVGGRTLRSRLIHGTGKFGSNEVLARCLEDVQCAAGVDIEVGLGIDQRCGDGDLRGEVKDRVLVLHMLGQRAGIPHVLFYERGSCGVLGDEPLEISVGAGAAQIVEYRYMPPALDQVRGGVDTEESRSAGDEDAACWHAVRLGFDLGLGAMCDATLQVQRTQCHGGHIP